MPQPAMPQQMYMDEKVIATQKLDATTALTNQAQTQASMLKHQCARLLLDSEVRHSRIPLRETRRGMRNANRGDVRT